MTERRGEIEREIKALKAELAEIRIAEDALAGRAPESVVLRGDRRQSLIVKEGSIKDWIIKVLTQRPDGLETDDVIMAVVGAGGPNIPRSSMTPQLSWLKSASLLTQEGRNWKIAASPDFFNPIAAEALATYRDPTVDPEEEPSAFSILG